QILHRNQHCRAQALYKAKTILKAPPQLAIIVVFITIVSVLVLSYSCCSFHHFISLSVIIMTGPCLSTVKRRRHRRSS
ncbi:MAG: hypothetical protein ACKPKO_04120, partial [Candidatus Fonsibacter sp.]